MLFGHDMYSGDLYIGATIMNEDIKFLYISILGSKCPVKVRSKQGVIRLHKDGVVEVEIPTVDVMINYKNPCDFISYSLFIVEEDEK